MVKYLALLLLLTSSFGAQAAVRASIDKNPLLAGEILTLTINNDANDDAPDLSVLEADFQILRQGSSSQFQMVNGRTSRSYDWIISLRPKRLGNLRIPPIRLGSDQTAAIDILVKKPDLQAGELPEAFIEQNLSKERLYVREQATLITRLFVRSDLVSGSFSEPSSDAAVLEQLGEQTETQELRGTQRYRVIERRYAVFPEQSGTVIINGSVFNGEIADPRQRRGVFGGGTRTVYAASDPITLDVQAQASGYTGAMWLPASQVQLSEEISPVSGPWRSGEPLTRTVTLTVRGQLHTQLPKLQLEQPAKAQSYTETPTDQTLSDGVQLIAVRKYSMAIIPSQAGALTLPEIQLDWWDTSADRARTARLPARTLDIAASTRAATAAASPPAPTVASIEPAEASTPQPAPISSENARKLWIWQIIALSALAGWLGTLAAWFWQRRQSIAAAKTSVPKSDTPDHKTLFSTLATGDAREARTALVAWARATDPRIQKLQDLHAWADDETRAALIALDACIYGLAAEFDRAVLQRFVSEFKHVETAQKKSPLPPLYPV